MVAAGMLVDAHVGGCVGDEGTAGRVSGDSDCSGPTNLPLSFLSLLRFPSLHARARIAAVRRAEPAERCQPFTECDATDYFLAQL